MDPDRQRYPGECSATLQEIIIGTALSSTFVGSHLSTLCYDYAQRYALTNLNFLHSHGNANEPKLRIGALEALAIF